MGRRTCLLRHPMVAGAALVLVVAACGDDGSGASAAPSGGERESASSPTETAGPAAGQDAEGLYARIPGIVEHVRPSVVTIDTGTGQGSGVIYDTDGVIVTNAHVVGDAAEVTVTFADGGRTPADVVAADATVDLAVVQAERDGLPTTEFATGLPRVGQLAVAVGNPLGFESTVTAGIVSGLERSIPGGGPSLTGLIQTDAPISPGNSGGALVDAGGQVMGINVAYIPPQGGAVSIGFAIPSPVVVDVVDELLDDGHVEHAFLGLTPHPLTPQLAERYGIDAEAGVLILDVRPDAPAADAGVEPGDVVVAIDDDPVEDLGDLVTALRQRDPGDTVTLTLVRGDERRTVDVELGRAP